MAAVIKASEASGAAELAARVLQRVKAIFRWAVTHERIDSNPMLDLVLAEILKPRQVTHRAALLDRELPAFLAKVAEYDGDLHTVQALRLLMLTATRPGEVRGARWAEIDLEAAQWDIPAERMKMHRAPGAPVPPGPGGAGTMKALSGGRELVFPSPYYPGKSLSENTFNSALARMGYKERNGPRLPGAVLHGGERMRAWNPDVIERQLAHAERNGARAAYHRADLPGQTGTKMMQWWADYLDGRKVGKVVKRPQWAA